MHMLLVAAMLMVSCAKEKSDVSHVPTETSAMQRLKLDPASLPRVGVVVEPAGASSALQRVELPGTLEYVTDRYAEVGYLAEGRITAVHVNVGDAVKRGQPLATLLVPEITRAQAQAVSAQASLDVARGHARREAALLENQLTSKRDEELARGQAAMAEADLAAAKAKLSLLGAKAPEGSTAIYANGRITLTSPIDGVVVERNAVLGAFVEPKDTVFEIADTRTLWAVLDVFESDVTQVRAGAVVDLTVDALPGKVIQGKVAMVEPQVGQASRALRARVSVPNDAGLLRRGLFVRAQIPVSESDGAALQVPKAAVQPLGERDVVFVESEPGVFEVRTVVTRPLSSQLVRVESGLSRGERIVVRGAFVLRGEVTKQ
jgi:cobalt-zinc-cadmium efflux system membrane fusion protein